MPNRNFHNWLPEWAYSSLDKRSCSQCSTNYQKQDIIAVGIRQTETEGADTPPEYAMYLEHQCSSCGFRGLTVLGKQKEDNLEKLCYVILEGVKKRKISEKSKMLKNHRTNDPISDKEVKDLREFMNNSKTHDDFLREIGVVLPEKDDDDSS